VEAMRAVKAVASFLAAFLAFSNFLASSFFASFLKSSQPASSAILDAAYGQ